MTQVFTVRGPIDPRDVGVCELGALVDAPPPGWEYAPEAGELLHRPRAFEQAQCNLVQFKALGGQTAVDLAGIGLRRDASLYADLSRETGVHIVASTGLGAESAMPPYFKNRDLDWTAELFVHEVTVGMGTSSRRAGVVAVRTGDDVFTVLEEQALRAAARASKATGVAAIARGARCAERQVEIFLEERADPTRVVIGGLDAPGVVDLERDRRIADRGFWIGYGGAGAAASAAAVAAQVEAGYLERIVVTCAGGVARVGPARNGEPQGGVGSLLHGWLPELEERGVTDSQVRTLLVENPRRVLAF